jgi:hypothetical protein
VVRYPRSGARLDEQRAADRFKPAHHRCYGWVLDGTVAKAIADGCSQNLGLAHAMGGDVAHASEAFARAGDRATEATTSKLETRSDDC